MTSSHRIDIVLEERKFQNKSLENQFLNIKLCTLFFSHVTDLVPTGFSMQGSYEATRTSNVCCVISPLYGLGLFFFTSKLHIRLLLELQCQACCVHPTVPSDSVAAQEIVINTRYLQIKLQRDHGSVGSVPTLQRYNLEVKGSITSIFNSSFRNRLFFQFLTSSRGEPYFNF